MIKTWKIWAWLVLGLAVAFIWWFAMALHTGAKADEAGPKWKIVVTITDPAGEHKITHGSQKDGVHWFATKEECEAALKNGLVPDAIKTLRAQLKVQKAPITVDDGKCVTDNSI